MDGEIPHDEDGVVTGEREMGMPVAQPGNLVTLGNGAAPELFSAELAKVLANIKDPNTSAQDKRKITLTFEFIPQTDRERVQVLISARSSMAASMPAGDTMMVGRVDGQLTAIVIHPQQRDPRQVSLDLPTNRQVQNG